MLAEYDFAGGVVGKYAARYVQGSNVVLLEPDVARVFPTSREVNEALRRLMEQQENNAREGTPRS